MKLPRELRDLVFQHALVEDEPIDLCPLPNEEYTEQQGYTGPAVMNSRLARAEANYRYRRAVARKLRIFRVSKTFLNEGAKIFFGQNIFRFSS